MNTIQRWMGNTVLLYNYRGDGLYRLLRVTRIRDTHDELLRNATRESNVITRGRYLLTGLDLHRPGVIHSYYVNHSEIRQVGFFGRMYHRMMVAVGVRVTCDE